MTQWICATCGVEQADSEQPNELCVICVDDRQYIRPSGQRWTSLAELQRAGTRGEIEEVEPNLYGITVSPQVGIGQRAFLVQTADGNLLWDPNGYVDDDLVGRIEAIGGVAAIAASHPHMFGVQVDWSHRFGDVPVYVAQADEEWIQRDDAVIQRWDGELEVLPGVRLHRVGGHFPGSAVAHFTGSDGQGVLLSGDTAVGTPDEKWAAFLRSYPNKVPLSAAVVRRIADRLAALPFDRMYDNTRGRIARDANAAVERSAQRHVSWVSGEFDHLT